MKRLMLTLVLLSGILFANGQQLLISGKVYHLHTNEPLPFVNISNGNPKQGTSTNLKGQFTIQIDSLDQAIFISHIGFKAVEIVINSNNLNELQIGLEPEEINLQEVSILAEVAQERYNPLSFNQIDAQTISSRLGDRTLPEIMERTPGVYGSRDGGGSGDASLSIRGFKQENIAVLLNGVPINGAENGLIYWNNWLGLTEATAGLQIQRGIGASKVALNSVGGTVNIITSQAFPKKQGFVSSNISSYGNQKFTLGYQTGQMDNGWSLSFLGSRLSGEGYIDASYVDAWAYFFSAGKSIGKNHRIVITLLGGPERHGQRTLKLSQKEIDAHGIKFNKDWGSYNGIINNASENFYHKPHLSVNHYLNISEKVYLNTAVYLSPGWGGGKWNDSFQYGPGVFDFRNPSGQIDWNSIYQYNANNTDTYQLANGNTVSGYSKLVQTHFLASHFWGGLMSTAEFKPTKNQRIITGIHYRYFQSTLKQKLNDLLGGSFYIDDYSWSMAGVAGRDQIKMPGDVIRIDNGALLHHTSLFAQWEFETGLFTFFVGGTLSDNRYRRHDSYNYPSDKWSEWVTLPGFDIKGGVNVNLNQQQHLYLNGGHFSKAPYYKFVFGNNTNTPVTGIKNEKVSTLEMGYGFRNGKLHLGLNAYYTFWQDVSFLNNEYIQLENQLQSRAMVQGLDALHQGIEFEGSIKLSKQIRLGSYLSIGNWQWKNDVEAVLFNNLDVAVDTVKVFADGLMVGGQPQLQAAVYLDFRLFDVFDLKVDLTHYDKHFADFAPDGRQNPEDKVQSFQIPAFTLLNVHLGTQLMIGKFPLSIYLNCNNLTNKIYILKGEDGLHHDSESFRGFWGFGTTFDLGMKLTF
jgi:hypothetical protein